MWQGIFHQNEPPGNAPDACICHLGDQCGQTVGIQQRIARALQNKVALQGIPAQRAGGQHAGVKPKPRAQITLRIKRGQRLGHRGRWQRQIWLMCLAHLPGGQVDHQIACHRTKARSIENRARLQRCNPSSGARDGAGHTLPIGCNWKGCSQAAQKIAPFHIGSISKSAAMSTALLPLAGLMTGPPSDPPTISKPAARARPAHRPAPKAFGSAQSVAP